MRLIGHRGARGEAPENTLSGFRHLRALGVRAVEFDIHLSADGELMVIHDAELSRTTSGHGLVREHSAAELAALNACHQPAHKGFAPWPKSEGVPTLAQVLTELSDFSHIELELKVQHEDDEAAVVAARKEGMLDAALVVERDDLRECLKGADDRNLKLGQKLQAANAALAAANAQKEEK